MYVWDVNVCICEEINLLVINVYCLFCDHFEKKEVTTVTHWIN